ncbi:ROK family protein [Catenulispora sp. GAS73]|uniref:ROK family protein n=1 Tax=Catenulispora sp. GAS73 TaxID=3156269 RepID=UPI0035131544
MAGAGVEALHSAVIGTGGIVDPATGDPVYVWGQPEWHEGLAARLRAEWGHPVVFENEVNLRAVAEHRLGAAQGEHSFVLLDLSEGVGLAVVLGGELHRGASGGAGEIGYLPVPGAPFGTFARHREARPGGFQALAGGEAVVELGRSLGVVVGGGDSGAGGTGGFGRVAGASPESATVAAAVAAQNEEFLEALAHRVSVGAAAVCAVLDPGFIVLSGTVARAAGSGFATLVEREITRLSPLRPRVAMTALPENAMLTGALMTGLETARDQVFGPAMRYTG